MAALEAPMVGDLTPDAKRCERPQWGSLCCSCYQRPPWRWVQGLTTAMTSPSAEVWHLSLGNGRGGHQRWSGVVSHRMFAVDAGAVWWWLVIVRSPVVGSWLCRGGAAPPPLPSDACGLDCGLLSIEQKLSPAFLPVRTMLTPSGADCLTGGIVLVLLSPIWRSEVVLIIFVSAVVPSSLGRVFRVLVDG
jgi:hypothetical protein